MTTKNRNNKGVTLLVVLALMTLFAMLTITFMVIASTASTSAISFSEYILGGKGTGGSGGSSGPEISIDFGTAIEKLLIGDKLVSVLGPHSIMENLYGNPEMSGNLIPISIGNASETPDGFVQIDPDDIFNEYPGTDLDYVGSVITFTNGTDTKSTHIIDLSQGIIAPFGDMNAEKSIDFINGTQTPPEPPANTAYINTPAFSGAGPDNEYPNFVASGYAPAGRLMNPDYTAPDWRTMFLAYNELDGNKVKRVIPSFLRPALYDGTTLSDDYYRRATLRPLPIDHPDFTGSNPAAKLDGNAWQSFLQFGPWDVDCDGDGIADSIWLDIGLPPFRGYKPLVAYYVLDMDGRVNINTAGHNNHLDTIGHALTGSSYGGNTTPGISSGAASIRLDKITDFT
ncbi:MAG: hypothetical protein FWE67_03425, partial [Planctomycetaceae bacterium]|nr:hypothetical protein [Planctomycetaceae bacterium]